MLYNNTDNSIIAYAVRKIVMCLNVLNVCKYKLIKKIKLCGGTVILESSMANIVTNGLNFIFNLNQL